MIWQNFRYKWFLVSFFASSAHTRHISCSSHYWTCVCNSPDPAQLYARPCAIYASDFPTFAYEIRVERLFSHEYYFLYHLNFPPMTIIFSHTGDERGDGISRAARDFPPKDGAHRRESRRKTRAALPFIKIIKHVNICIRARWQMSLRYERWRDRFGEGA